MSHPSMHLALRAACVSIALGSFLRGQSEPEDDGPLLAGDLELTVPGVAGGNTNVDLLVHYPSATGGKDSPLDDSAAPYPLVVFGHGFSLPADLYDTLYQHLATRGYVVAAVATEAGLFTGNLPRFIKDYHAAVLGLRDEAGDPASLLFGAVEADVLAGCAGHSFGGAAAIVAAFERPDLFAGVVTLAATATSPQGVDILEAAAGLTVPALHVGASEDVIVPPGDNLDVIYAETPPDRRLLEIDGGTHSYFHEADYWDRLFEPPGDISVAEQQRITRRYWLSFWEWSLRRNPEFLDELLGPTAVGDSALSRQEIQLQSSLVFGPRVAAIGANSAMHPARQPGDQSLLWLSPGTGFVPTQYGDFLLDPLSLFYVGLFPVDASSYGTFAYAIPDDPGLSGAIVYWQGLLVWNSDAAFTNLWTLEIP